MTAVASPPPAKRATLADLYSIEGKAELIGGRIVAYAPTVRRHNRIAGNIYASLREYCKQSKKGEAYTGNVGFVVPVLSSGRESFTPDASMYFGPLSDDETKFRSGPPDFAAEVRSPEEYGPAAESQLRDKRSDYFEAGTKVVWDVDPVAGTISVYRAKDPQRPIVFGNGDSAHAEPAMPRWTVKVDSIFRRP